MKASFVVIFLLSFSASVFAQVEDFAGTDFSKADSIARLYPNYSLKNLPELANKLTRPLLTEQEKFRAIYTWTCLNIENDYELFLKNQRKRAKLKDPEALSKWNKELGAVVFETLLKKHRTICTGYAYLLRELSLHTGITCVIVDGYGRTAQSNIGGPGIPNHSWSAVQLNNKWYLCDATWSSGAIDLEQKEFVARYNDSYFLLDPALFARNHYPLDTTKMFLSDGPSLTEFLNRPLIYAYFFPYKITKLQPETFTVTATKNKPVDFLFDSNGKAIEKIELSIKGPSVITSSNPQLQSKVGTSSFSHTFIEKGMHTVHVLFNEEYVFTYQVNVNK